MIERRKTFPTLPLGGTSLVLLFALFLLPGLAGHDPWKVEDANHFGVVWRLVQGDGWLNLNLAGEPWPEAPLYYWLAALTAKALAWILPVHDGARVATSLCAAFAFFALSRAGREFHGRDHQTAAPLLLAGSLGLLVHVHETQPAIAYLAAQAAGLWGLALMQRRPLYGTLIFGSATGLAVLTTGLGGLPSLVLPSLALPFVVSEYRGRTALANGAGLLLGAFLAALWPLALALYAPGQLEFWWSNESNQLQAFPAIKEATLQMLSIAPWYAWPALPVAAWTLWMQRRQLTTPALLLPLLATIGAALSIVTTTDARSIAGLPLLPPLALLAAAGLPHLRRGAANGFDWFGMITFTLAGGLVWLGWGAMTWGHPEQIARNFAKLSPGYEAAISPLALGLATATTLAWFWLIFSSPRSPYRAATHWLAGMTLVWALVSTLWLPWIDHGKTYRPVVDGLARALPPHGGCIAGRGLTPAMRTALDYFADIRTTPLASEEGQRCRWLITLGSARTETMPEGSWKQIWEGHRASDRSERLRLFHRTK
ncbi:MAG: hypothetical protein KGN39_05045 [Betaproteobacteria bacterium]|nr:hypothetical protein [Betaproteobacteria bacterium]